MIDKLHQMTHMQDMAASKKDTMIVSKPVVKEQEYMTVSEQDYQQIIFRLKNNPSLDNPDNPDNPDNSNCRWHIPIHTGKIIPYIKYKNEFITMAQAVKLEKKCM